MSPNELLVIGTLAFGALRVGLVLTTKAQAPAIAVLTSSVVAEAGFANHEAVAAAKCAVTGLALSAAATYADKGVRVNVVAPGLTRSTLTQRFIATPEAEARSAALIPVNRIAEPDDVAHAFSFLLSPYAAHITGQVIRVDGGQGVLRPLPRRSRPDGQGGTGVADMHAGEWSQANEHIAALTAFTRTWHAAR